MKTMIIKLAMLFAALSVLLLDTGCGREADILYSEEMGGTDADAGVSETADGAGVPETAETADGVQAPDADAGEMPDDAQAAKSAAGRNAKSTEAADKGEASADGNAGNSKDTSESSTVQTVFVHVCGAVNNPGVYEVAVDARIYEAVASAGGCTADASADSLNLAQAVTDGMRVYVPTIQEAKAAAAAGNIASAQGSLVDGQWISDADSSKAQDGSGTEAQAGAAQTKVSINTAAKEELMTLPGIGESKAESIIAYREEHGAFRSIEEIMQISGIKESVFSKIKEKIKL